MGADQKINQIYKIKEHISEIYFFGFKKFNLIKQIKLFLEFSN